MLGYEAEWREYMHAIEVTPEWAHFGCQSARIIASDAGSLVECSGVGPVFELMMTTSDLVEAHPVPRFAKMPLAMALLITRRALWHAPRTYRSRRLSMRVAFGGRPPIALDESGDWISA